MVIKENEETPAYAHQKTLCISWNISNRMINVEAYLGKAIEI